jgi:hypothetical protein
MLKAAIAIAAIAGVALLGPAARSPAHAVPNLGMTDVGDADVIQVKSHGRHHMAHSRASGRHYYARRHHFRHRHFRGRFYGGYVYAGHRCGWLRHRAIVTGSAYWWRRYYRCRRGW